MVGAAVVAVGLVLVGAPPAVWSMTRERGRPWTRLDQVVAAAGVLLLAGGIAVAVSAAA
jgi:hypothetical protein